MQDTIFDSLEALGKRNAFWVCSSVSQHAVHRIYHQVVLEALRSLKETIRAGFPRFVKKLLTLEDS